MDGNVYVNLAIKIRPIIRNNMSHTEPCPQCRTKGEDKNGDNLHTHPEYAYKKCFKCDYFESIDGMLSGKCIEVADRGITKATCEKYDIQMMEYTGKFYQKKLPIDVDKHRCALFNYYDNTNKPVLQKIRSMSTKQIIILFDNDEAGKEATVKAINMLPVGSSYLANLSEKDANDMVVQGKFGELKTALWNSKPYKP